MVDQSDLDTLWGQLLSHHPDAIRAAFFTLNPDEQAAILAHLQLMSIEPDWHPEQRLSAETALSVLKIQGE